MKTKTKNEIIKLFWIFMVASIIGCIVETIVCIVQKGHFEIRQGVIYGPFIPVYGAGAVFFYLLVPKVTGATTQNTKEISFIKIFLYTAVIGGLVEYVFSYGQECLFGTVSWEYSKLPFNLNGRTSLLHCIYWGLGGIIFIKWLYPYTIKLDDFNYLSKKAQFTTVALFTFMIFNMTISMFAGYRQYERTKNIAADTRFEQFLDKHYPDKIMDIIFSNKQNTKEMKRGKRTSLQL